MTDMGLGFKLWFAFCALVGLAVTGTILWCLVVLTKAAVAYWGA